MSRLYQGTGRVLRGLLLEQRGEGLGLGVVVARALHDPEALVAAVLFGAEHRIAGGGDEVDLRLALGGVGLEFVEALLELLGVGQLLDRLGGFDVAGVDEVAAGVASGQVNHVNHLAVWGRSS